MDKFLINVIADYLVIPIVILGVWALLMIPNDQKYRAYCRVLLAGLTAYLTAKLIGAVFQPETMRPFQKLGIEAGASFMENPGFPSDHVLFCTSILLAVWFETRRVAISLILAVLTLLVALGRVLGFVHTPLDVIGGAVIACIGAVWYLQRERVSLITSKSRKTSKKSVQLP